MRFSLVTLGVGVWVVCAVLIMGLVCMCFMKSAVVQCRYVLLLSPHILLINTKAPSKVLILPSSTLRKTLRNLAV